MSLRDELQRPQVKALLIGGAILALLAIAIYFATKKGQGAMASSNPNGLNNDASGSVPEVLVLPPPIIQLAPPPAPGTPPANQPPIIPGQGGPTGILSQPPLGLPPSPTPPPSPMPYVYGLTGPTGIHS